MQKALIALSCCFFIHPLVAFASSESTLGPYYLDGPASTKDYSKARLAGARLRSKLQDLSKSHRHTKVVISGVFILDAPLEISAYNSGLLLVVKTGRSALLLSEGANSAIEIKQSSNVTISGLKFRGFLNNGIYVSNSQNVTIKDNIVEDTMSSSWSQGAIHLTGNVPGSVIINNSIRSSNYAAIIADTDVHSNLSNLRIANNYIMNSCRVVRDCGAIYVNDRGRSSSGIVISDNVIDGFGLPPLDGRAIYLDDWASGVSVYGNIIKGVGMYAFQVHGGRDNKIVNNTVFLARIFRTVLYMRASEGTLADMTGNSMRLNRFFVNGTTLATHFQVRRPLNAGILDFSDNLICGKVKCSRLDMRFSPLLLGSRQ